jgi:DNA invertase Pin-like site-specific DNA recombinase
VRERCGLKELLTDVLTGHARFHAILVYDVSRWGRFQDLDEAAHYEFLCKTAGIPVHYVAEQFGSGSSMADIMLKALKRTMAAEYSRELGERVARAKGRIEVC